MFIRNLIKIESVMNMEINFFLFFIFVASTLARDVRYGYRDDLCINYGNDTLVFQKSFKFKADRNPPYVIHSVKVSLSFNIVLNCIESIFFHSSMIT